MDFSNDDSKSDVVKKVKKNKREKKSIKTLFAQNNRKTVPAFFFCSSSPFIRYCCVHKQTSREASKTYIVRERDRDRVRSPNWFIAVASQEYQLRLFPKRRGQKLSLMAIISMQSQGSDSKLQVIRILDEHLK